MTTVYFIRHAQAEGNLTATVQGNIETGITALGYEQIAALRGRFADIPVDAVYSSDLRRATETAKAVSAPKNLPIHTDKAFREVDFGRWEGHRWSELAVTDSEQVENFNHHLERFQPPEGETAQQLLARFLPALENIVRENEDKTVVIVSHGLALRLVLGALQGIAPENITSLHGPNTAVSKVAWENGTPRVIYQDDGAHVAQLGGQKVQGKDWWK